MTPLRNSKQAAARASKLVELSRGLPEVEVVRVPGERHFALRIRGKTFAWYQYDHHGDGVVSICCKSTHADQAGRVAAAPDRYFVPDYLGAKGWIALRLDLPRVAWKEVAELLTNAYCYLAPRRLAEQVA